MTAHKVQKCKQPGKNKQENKQTKKQEDQKSEEQARIPRNLATSMTISAPKVRAKKRRRKRKFTKQTETVGTHRSFFCFYFSTDASHREEEIQIVLEPEEARTKMRLDEQQVVTGVSFEFSFYNDASQRRKDTDSCWKPLKHEESPNDCRHRSAQNATMAPKSSTADPRTEAQSATTTTTTTTIHTHAYSKQRDQRARRQSGEAEGHGQQNSRKTSCT